jgi:hypothetical protein
MVIPYTAETNTSSKFFKECSSLCAVHNDQFPQVSSYKLKHSTNSTVIILVQEFCGCFGALIGTIATHVY